MHEVRDTFGAHTPWQALELEFQHLGSRTAPEPRWRALSGWVYRCVEGSGDKVQKERPRPSTSPQEQGATLSLPVCSTPNKKPQRSPDAWVHLTSSSGSSSGQNCSWSLVLLLPRRLHVNRWQFHPTTCWAHVCRCYPWHFLALSITNLLASLSPLPSNILNLPTSPALLCLHLTQPSNLPPGPAQSPPSRSLAHLHCLLPSNLYWSKLPRGCSWAPESGLNPPLPTDLLGVKIQVLPPALHEQPRPLPDLSSLSLPHSLCSSHTGLFTASSPCQPWLTVSALADPLPGTLFP